VDKATRFWAKVDVRGADDCWEWQRGRSRFGYGSVLWGGRQTNAHRVAYMLSAGPIPAGMCVLHRCDNPPCVNPAHLFLGTKADNIADMVAKGRGRYMDRPAPDIAGLRVERLRGPWVAVFCPCCGDVTRIAETSANLARIVACHGRCTDCRKRLGVFGNERMRRNALRTSGIVPIS
jgi:hypothetical protein